MKGYSTPECCFLSTIFPIFLANVNHGPETCNLKVVAPKEELFAFVGNHKSQRRGLTLDELGYLRLKYMYVEGTLRDDR